MANELFVDFIQVHQNKMDDHWYYVAKSRNGNTLFTSKGYQEKDNCIEAAGFVANAFEISVEVKGE